MAAQHELVALTGVFLEALGRVHDTVPDTAWPEVSESAASGYARGWLKRHVAGYAYRPGWEFRLVESSRVTPWREYPDMVRILARVPDTRAMHDPDKFVTIEHAVPVPVDDPRQVDRLVWEAIERIEAHERMEYFKRDGVWVQDPHPDGVVASVPTW